MTSSFSTSNPLFQREFRGLMRAVPLLAGAVALLAAMELLRLFVHNIMIKFPSSSGGFSRTGFPLIMVPYYVAMLFLRPVLPAALLLIWESVAREQRAGGWRALAVTRLGPGQILWGKVAPPLIFLFLASICVSALARILHGSHTLDGAVKQFVFVLSQFETAAYLVMCGLVFFHFLARKADGATALRAFVIFLALSLLLLPSYIIPFFFTRIFYTLLRESSGESFAQAQMLIQSAAFLILTVPVELFLAWRFRNLSLAELKRLLSGQ